MEGFSDILSEQQLEGIDCAVLTLLAAVTEYLAVAIVYYTDKGTDGPQFRKTWLTALIVAYVRNALQDMDKFVWAKVEIGLAKEAFITLMGYLMMRIGAELLRNNKTEKRQNVLKWIWSEDYGKRHEGLRRIHVSSTWNRILGYVEDWINKKNSGLLIYQGIRKKICYLTVYNTIMIEPPMELIYSIHLIIFSKIFIIIYICFWFVYHYSILLFCFQFVIIYYTLKFTFIDFNIWIHSLFISAIQHLCCSIH